MSTNKENGKKTMYAYYVTYMFNSKEEPEVQESMAYGMWSYKSTGITYGAFRYKTEKRIDGYADVVKLQNFIEMNYTDEASVMVQNWIELPGDTEGEDGGQ